MKGFTGKILDLDLEARHIGIKVLSETEQASFLGGRGINMSILYEELQKKKIEPFSIDNPLIFGAGPLVGTHVPANGRYNVSCISPLTGMLADSNAAGIWPVLLKKAGYDGIILRGRSDKPVFISIQDNKVKIEDATDLWGLSVSETTARLKERFGQKSQVLAIGLGGENLVRYACIMNDIDRAAGRSGPGAIMGYKKVKAIVINGSGAVSVVDPGKLQAAVDRIKTAMKNSPSYTVRSIYGTPMLTMLYNNMGVLPTRNNQSGVFEGAEMISGERLKKLYVVKPKSCFACPVHCSRVSRIAEGPYAGTELEGPEFETICSLGSRCGNSDLEAIIYMNRLVNDLGIDSISLGGTLAYAMECYEKGLLTAKDFNGLEMTWGNSAAMIDLIKKIACREGIGDILAEGVKRAAEKIPNSEGYALHVKGMEVPTQEVRGLKAWGLGWAVSSRGADHCRAFPVMETTWTPEMAESFFGDREAANRFAYSGKGRLIKWAEDYGAVIDALGLCTISYIAMGLTTEMVAEAFNAVTGADFTDSDLLRAGDRINNLERLINLKLGLTPAIDTLPERFIKEPLPEGASAGQTIDIEVLVKDYYKERGWDFSTGFPGEETLKKLSLPPR